MASEPERSREVGNRMSLVIASIMVMDTSPTSFSERLSGENPQPRFVPAGAPGGAGLRALYLETGAAQQLQARLTVVVAPPHRGAPALPVAILTLPRPQRPRRQEAAARLQPAPDPLEQSGMLGAGHVDDGVEGHYRVEGLGGEAQVGHVGPE